MFYQQVAFPYFTPGTAFNCVVTWYDSSTGVLSFNATPTINDASCKFGIIVRSGEGTGIISSTTLETSTFTVDRTLLFYLPQAYNGGVIAADGTVISGSYVGNGIGTITNQGFQWNANTGNGTSGYHAVTTNAISGNF